MEGMTISRIDNTGISDVKSGMPFFTIFADVMKSYSYSYEQSMLYKCNGITIIKAERTVRGVILPFAEKGIASCGAL